MKIICLATNEIGEVSDAIGSDIDLLKSMGYAQHSLTEIPLFCQQNLTNETNTETIANTETNREAIDTNTNDKANNIVKVSIKRATKKRVNKPQKEKDHAS